MYGCSPINFTTSATSDPFVFNVGNVGIGLTNPSEKLDVAGNIHASGTIQAGSSIVIDGSTDQITATGGTISFVDENLTTTGAINTGSITVSGNTTMNGAQYVNTNSTSSWHVGGDPVILRNSDYFVVHDLNANFLIQLPDPITNAGRVIMIKNMNISVAFINVICITPTIISINSAGPAIPSVQVLQGDSRRYTSDGTYWYESY